MTNSQVTSQSPYPVEMEKISKSHCQFLNTSHRVSNSQAQVLRMSSKDICSNFGLEKDWNSSGTVAQQSSQQLPHQQPKESIQMISTKQCLHPLPTHVQPYTKGIQRSPYCAFCGKNFKSFSFLKEYTQPSLLMTFL